MARKKRSAARKAALVPVRKVLPPEEARVSMGERRRMASGIAREPAFVYVKGHTLVKLLTAYDKYVDLLQTAAQNPGTSG